ncbi:hypothetical protein [Thioalkalivibrio sp. HK1]|uniref:hypothetical protein n=1 Tax=Thioalkalivibrio sp. HK1 TaxID=1469245 RepID=UPI000471A184|nr:hypothetical protein [Thioalkalivibrio sp. HK1]
MVIRALFSLIGICLVGSALAASVIQVQFPELVEDAEKIAVGTVGDITVVHDAAQDGLPVTRVRFDSLNWWKGGNDERTITVEFVGGEMPDGSVIHVAGMPVFKVGEEHLLFWKDGRRYINPFVGWWQGHYKVEVNQAGQSVVKWPQRMIPPEPEGEGSKGAASSSASSGGDSPRSSTLHAGLAAPKGNEPVEEISVDLLKQRVLSEMAK